MPSTFSKILQGNLCDDEKAPGLLASPDYQQETLLNTSLQVWSALVFLEAECRKLNGKKLYKKWPLYQLLKGYIEAETK